MKSTQHICHNSQSHNILSDKYDNKHTEIYNNIEQSRIEQTIKDLLLLFKKQNPVTVLDFGAGTGNLSLKFLQENCLVTACDVSIKSLLKLSEKSFGNKNLQIVKLEDDKLPFPDNSFDIVATYSVLHHIPEYLRSVSELIRVCKPGGCIYIDHEHNENYWNPDSKLIEWKKKTKLRYLDHFLNLIKSFEIFSPLFLKTVFMKLFVNKRYEREGDIHVWPDDHIEWSKMMELFRKNQCEIVKETDYLLFSNQVSYEEYIEFGKYCSDMKMIIARKLNLG